MRRRKFLFGIGAVGLVAAVIVMTMAGSDLLGGDSGVAPEGITAGDGAVVAGLTGESSGEGSQETIKVHGRWTIEVSDPDGTVVERREFENALFAGNGFILAEFLGRMKTVGFWQVQLSDGLGGDPPCVTPSNSSNSCYLVESASSFTATFSFKTLVVDVPSSGANSGKLVLAGTLTAQRDGSISQVETLTERCDPTVAPDTPCEGGTRFVITRTTLGNPVTVTTNQQVAVTVVISFS